MADADFSTLVSDVVVPEIFTPYVQQMTEEKSRLVQSGVLARSPFLDQLLAGGGLTFNVPSWKDLDNDTENVSSDDAADHWAESVNGTSVDTSLSAMADSRPKATGTDQEVAVRMNRNQSWSSSDLTAALAGADPMNSIATRVSDYWTRRLQAAFIATMNGVCKDNADSPDGGDYGYSIVGGAYAEGVTTISAEAIIDTALTMGDSMEDLSAMMVHSVVYARMQKNNLIDFIPDARGEVNIPTFMGREVIVDDGMPSGSGVVQNDDPPSAGVAGMYETWLFGSGAISLGVGSPKVPTAVTREEQAGNGGGQEILYNRVQWTIHPHGHAYTGTAPNGGPSNAASTNNLNDAGSWDRRWPERKMVKFARLISRES